MKKGTNAKVLYNKTLSISLKFCLIEFIRRQLFDY